MKELVEMAFQGYIQDTEIDKNYIIVSGNFKEECKTINENFEEIFNYELEEKLNNMLINRFKKAVYEIYKNGSYYAYNGRIMQVNADQDFVAIKNNKE